MQDLQTNRLEPPVSLGYLCRFVNIKAHGQVQQVLGEIQVAVIFNSHTNTHVCTWLKILYFSFEIYLYCQVNNAHT